MKIKPLLLPILLFSTPVWADGGLHTVVIEGRKTSMVGVAVSASEGVVSQEDFGLRPHFRTGEVLELVPGMVVTQHSGTGKANQYFLRGFNLDHGSDFATSVDGMPANMRTHGHGQGYTDLNFLIPETIDKLNYRKGSYYAEVGDFSGAGSAQFASITKLAKGKAEATLGDHDYQRAVFLDSYDMKKGDILLAAELNQYNGPWTDIEEDLSKRNAMIKYTRPLEASELSFSFMSYASDWNSADQIPQRAVDSGLIDALGSIDDSVGGESSRHSLSVNWNSKSLDISAYLIRYDMNLWSNFTYYLEDEVNGDQFEQVDDRTIYGGQIEYAWAGHFGETPVVSRVGTQVRVDDIKDIALHKTQTRRRLGTIRRDRVNEESLGLYWDSTIAWSERLSSVIGARVDHYSFEVEDKVGTNVNDVNLADNSGNESDSISSLKASVMYQFHPEWELYASAGQGFHSNDARGTTIQTDPADGTAIDSVDPLVRSVGYETGVRGFINDQINTSLSLWSLELDSELLFVGDAGNTEASAASERRGLELAAYYYFDEHWNIDVEYAYSDAGFKDAPRGQEHIPGAIEHVLQFGLSFDLHNGWFGSLRTRYFGKRPLIEDASVKSDASTIVNLRTGYNFGAWTVQCDVLNLMDSDDHDVDYFYESRLSGDASGVATEDVHYHVFEPRALRLSVAYTL